MKIDLYASSHLLFRILNLLVVKNMLVVIAITTYYLHQNNTLKIKLSVHCNTKRVKLPGAVCTHTVANSGKLLKNKLEHRAQAIRQINSVACSPNSATEYKAPDGQQRRCVAEQNRARVRPFDW